MRSFSWIFLSDIAGKISLWQMCALCGDYRFCFLLPTMLFLIFLTLQFFFVSLKTVVFELLIFDE